MTSATNDNKSFRLKPVKGLTGFLIYTALLFLSLAMLPDAAFDPASKLFIVVLGMLGLWRYSWGLLHYIRALIFRKKVFPQLRSAVDANIGRFLPPHIYILVTSYRIQGATTAEVYRAVIEEAVQCGLPCMIVASIVELGDEFLIKELFRHYNPPPSVRLSIVRIPGTGKRDALAHGFRAISRDMPLQDSVVAIVDGDSILEKNLLLRCAPFFRLMPGLGALTTDEDCQVRGSRLIREWHRLRFAQRQIYMCSMALSAKCSR